MDKILSNLKEMIEKSSDPYAVYLARVSVDLLFAAAPQVVADERAQPELTVWYGSMPESNGKSNFTAMLSRKDAQGLDKFDGLTIARSEYPDRVRYEADCVRFLIGELAEKPCILDYDDKAHSGYVELAAPVQAQELSDATIINAANKYGISPHAAMSFVRELIGAQSTTQEIRAVANPVEFDGIKTDAVKAQEPIGYAPSYLTERMAAGDSAVMLTVTRKPLPGHGITVALYTAPVQPVAVPKAALADRVDAENYRAMLRVAERHGYSSISCAIKSAPRRPVLDGVKNYSIQAAPAAQGDKK